MASKIHNLDLNSLFYYDESSVTYLRWNTDVYCGRGFNRKNVSKGDIAGQKGKGSKCSVSVKRKMYLVHRIVWEIFYGHITDSSLVVDHIDGNPLNNNIKNLRLVDLKVNARNRRLSTNNKTGTIGVYFYKHPANKSGDSRSYFVASWWEEGKQNKKYFSVEDFGDKEARAFAISFREAKIAELNNKGADYSYRHGVRVN